jgi:hypothetical protein
VVTRRALLVAGAAAGLAGCGKDEAVLPPPRPAESLLRQLAAERALAAAVAGGDEELARRAADRARRLAVALSEEGGRPHDAPAPGDVPWDPVNARRRAEAALEAHVMAMPDLNRRELRRLGADLVAEWAADAARLGAPTDNAFPGTPT